MEERSISFWIVSQRWKTIYVESSLTDRAGSDIWIMLMFVTLWLWLVVLMPDISDLSPALLPCPRLDLVVCVVQTGCQMPEILIKCGPEFKISSRWHYQQFWSGQTVNWLAWLRDVRNIPSPAGAAGCRYSVQVAPLTGHWSVLRSVLITIF